MGINNQHIKTFRFSSTEFNVPIPKEIPVKNSLFDYLGWVYENYYDFIDKKQIHTEHFYRKNHCLRQQYYSISICPNCNKLHYDRLPCNSFFCEECHSYLVKRAQASLSEYLWNVRHRFVIFTTPPVVRDKLMWGNMNWFYKAVHKTMIDYFKHYFHDKKVQVGMMAFLHSYGSRDLGWKPHLNIMWSCKGFLEIKKQAHEVKTGYVDYKKLRKIYKKNLEYYFCVKLDKDPVIYFDEEDKRTRNDKTLGIEPGKVVNKLAQYFKKLPFKDKTEEGHKSNIIKVDEIGNITWTTYKRKKEKLIPITMPPIQFYNLIMQHIPHKNFRNVRLWGCYQYQHHLRKSFPPLKKPKEIEPQLCSECHIPFDHVMIVARNQIIFIKLDCKDFSAYFPASDHPDLLGSEPPGALKPSLSLTFQNITRKKAEKRDDKKPLAIEQPMDAGTIITEGLDYEFFNTKINWNKQAFMDKLFYDIGSQVTNFRVCNTYLKEGEQFFSKWHNYMDIQGTMFADKCNQREQLKNEIILDQDKGDYLALIKRLKQDNVRFYAYSTEKGRAQHIHCYFKGLAGLSKFDRENLREKFIKKYNCDPMLKIDSHMIALEFCEHWKTKGIKKLIDYNEGVNTIAAQERETIKSNADFEKYLGGFGGGAGELGGIKIR